MQEILDTIFNKPIGLILNFLSDITGGKFALAVFLFTLIINLALIPLSIKTQRTSAQQTRIKPKLDLLRKKYADDQMRLNQETNRLYQEEKISATSGCLPMLIRMLFLMAIFYSITRPLTIILGMPSEQINTAAEALKTLGSAGKSNYQELAILGNLSELGNAGAPIAAALEASHLDFTLFGLDLTATPKFSINIFNDFQMIWLIPLTSFAAAMLTSIINLQLQKKSNPDAPRMTGMMLTMPLISLWIAFTVPAAVGLYWVYSNLISGGIQIIISQIYNPFKIIANDQAKAVLARRADEQNRMKAKERTAE